MKQLERRGTLPEWYEGMMDDCKSILVESEFTARWALVDGYHQIGQRILAESDNFNRKFMTNEEVVRRVAMELGRPSRLVYNCIQFAKKYPDLETLPGGKNTSWRDIVHKYLPEPQDVVVPVAACRHCPLHCEARNV